MVDVKMLRRWLYVKVYLSMIVSTTARLLSVPAQSTSLDIYLISATMHVVHSGGIGARVRSYHQLLNLSLNSLTLCLGIPRERV